MVGGGDGGWMWYGWVDVVVGSAEKNWVEKEREREERERKNKNE